MEEPIFQQRTDLSALNAAVMAIRSEIKKIIVGQDEMVKLIIAALLADGHVLIEGVPGVAKTLTAKLVAKSVNAGFSRVQFTPDLMPSDVLGTPVFNPKEASFEFKKGPVFSNIILVDEINRAPAKTQSALLEIMEERQATIDGKTYPMASPFMVLATQNPVEQEGTYRLPEAQLDRFMLYIGIDYPSLEEELAIVQATTGAPTEEPQPLLSAARIIEFQTAIRNMPLSNHVLEYAVRLARSTRPNSPDARAEVKKWVNWGAGPRASQYLVLAAKARAALDGRLTPAEEDVRAVAVPVLSHRILVSFAAEAEGVRVADIIKQILE